MLNKYILRNIRNQNTLTYFRRQRDGKMWGFFFVEIKDSR